MMHNSTLTDTPRAGHCIARYLCGELASFLARRRTRDRSRAAISKDITAPDARLPSIKSPCYSSAAWTWWKSAAVAREFRVAIFLGASGGHARPRTRKRRGRRGRSTDGSVHGETRVGEERCTDTRRRSRMKTPVRSCGRSPAGLARNCRHPRAQRSCRGATCAEIHSLSHSLSVPCFTSF